MKLLAIAAFALTLGSRWAPAAEWRQFRGNESNGAAVDAVSVPAPPAHWSPTENVAWKVALPGRGTSSPIVVGGRAVVTCSSGVRQDRLHVLAFDVTTGRLVWERRLWATGRTICHPMTAVATPTPASDGRRVFCYFSSNDLVAFDLAGHLLWMRALGLEHPQAGDDFALASSPLVIGDAVVVQSEGQGDSFAAAFDASTGATRWQIARPRRGSWSSPSLLHRSAAAGGDLVLLQSTSGLSAHDPATGRTVWTLATTCNDIASTATAGDTIFLPTSGGIEALRAPEAAVEPLWTSPKLSFGAASPVVYEGLIYTVNRAGVLNCGDAASGAVAWQLRLKGAIWGSPAIAGRNMYLVNRDGAGLVVRLPPGEKDPKLPRRGELIGEGAIDEAVLSSPAIAGSALYIRSDAHLWKIAAAQ